jgi:ParB-like chromosome segregation protein Spo0J
MLYDDIEDPESTSPEELRAGYVADLAAVIEARGGVEAVADETGADRESVAALAEGSDSADAGAVPLADAVEVAALAEDAPPADVIDAEIQDTLLMGMTTAVLDVDTIAAEIDADMDGKQVHQKVEGRAPMTLDEYARLHHFIASRQR